jgi:hypothetical protein
LFVFILIEDSVHLLEFIRQKLEIETFKYFGFVSNTKWKSKTKKMETTKKESKYIFKIQFVFYNEIRILHFVLYVKI